MKCLLFAALAVPLTAHAADEELLCKGTAWLPDGKSAEHRLVFVLDSETSHAMVKTLNGFASGTLEKGLESYTGHVSSKTVRYLVSFDRFEGELLLLPLGPDGKPTKQAEFSGTCERRKPQF